MLCCRKRPPSPNEKSQKPAREASPANGKAKTPPPADNQTNGHSAGPNGVAKPEAVVLEERKPSPSKEPSPQKESPQKGSPKKGPSPQRESPKKGPSPQRESPKKSPSPQKGSPKKGPSPQRESPKKGPSPQRESPKKAPSPQKESPRKSPSPQKESPKKAVSPTKAASPVRFPEAALADYLKRLETTNNVDELLKQGKDLLVEAKKRRAAAGLDAKMSSDLTNLITRLEAVTSRLESVASSGGGGGASDEALAAAVLEFDDIVNGPFATFMQKSGQIGGLVDQQAQMVKAAFQEERALLVIASKSKQPNQDNMQKLLQPLSEKISGIQELREQNRVNKDYFNHLSVISEGIGALGWVAVSPAPGPYVKEMLDSGQFYSNRVLKEYKEKDKTHVEWVRAWSQILTEMQGYIKKNHTTGLSWNKQGPPASIPSAGAAPPPPPPKAGGPPPPPPPGPPPPPADLNAGPAGEDPDKARGQLFASLNQGTDITKSLRKVKDDEKTHKNTALRLQSPVPYKAAAQSPKAFAKVAPVEKPPKTELDGKKWNIEYHKGNKNIVLDDVNMKQQIYIYRCQNSTIQVKGKVNSIVLDNCKKCAIVFESLVAALETVNCQSIQAQSLGKVPTISIDKTDGFQLYLNKDSLAAEIVSAKSSEMNILVPQADGEFKEYALPEQYKSIWSGSGFKTTSSDINS